MKSENCLPLSAHYGKYKCKKAEEMYSEILAERVRELKETQEGVDSMCIAMENLYNEGKLEGQLEGRENEKKNISCRLADRGVPAETIAQIVQRNVSLVKEWISQK